MLQSGGSAANAGRSGGGGGGRRHHRRHNRQQPQPPPPPPQQQQQQQQRFRLVHQLQVRHRSCGGNELDVCLDLGDAAHQEGQSPSLVALLGESGDSQHHHQEEHQQHQQHQDHLQLQLQSEAAERQLCGVCCWWLHRLWCRCGLGRASPESTASAAAATAAAMRGALRQKPASLSSLAQRTRFSRQELRLMYRGFKNECPTGVVHRAAFREIFSQFFPLGDASAYADLVFSSFDVDRCGWLTFEAVIQGLSVICKGSTMEKLDWAFRLYDSDQDGYISLREMAKVVSAIYAMLDGGSVRPPVSQCDAQRHAERIFQAMDLDGDGQVSFQEFAMACSRGRDLERELGCFDTLL